jgi:O-antigen/teichoic acid export membrane protein
MTLRGAVLRSVLQQNATILISFTAGIIIARLLTPAEFGVYAVAIAILAITMALKDFGIASYVISADGKDEKLLGSAYGLSLAMTFALALLVIAASWPLAAFYGDETVGFVLRIAALAPMILALVFPGTVLLTRQMRFDVLLVAGVGGALAQSFVSVLLAFHGFGAAALGWGYLAGSLATAGFTFVHCRAMGAVRPSMRGWRKLLGFSGIMSATLTVGSTASSAPQLIIGKVLGLADAALLARAQTIVTLILNGFFHAITRPMLRGLSEAEHRDGDIAPLYLRIVEAVTGLAWPAYAALCVWAVPLVRTLYGEAWSGAGALVLPMALGHALSLAVAPHHDVLIVKRRPGLLFLSETVIFAAMLAALAALLPFGLGIAVWAMAFGGAFFAVWYFFVLRPLAGFRLAAIARVWGRSLLLTSAVLPPLLAFRHASDSGLMPFPAAFVCSGMVAALLWLTAIQLSGHELAAQMRPLLGRLPLPMLQRPFAIRHGGEK